MFDLTGILALLAGSFMVGAGIYFMWLLILEDDIDGGEECE